MYTMFVLERPGPQFVYNVMHLLLRTWIGTLLNVALHGLAVYALFPVPGSNWWIDALKALAVTWIILSYMFFQFQLTPLRFSKTYYRISTREKHSGLYRWIGVPLFRSILINSPFRWINPKLYVRGSGKEELRRLSEFTREAETAHVLDALLTAVLTAVWWISGHVHAAIWLIICNIIFNAYPIALQRYTRLRLETINL